MPARSTNSKASSSTTRKAGSAIPRSVPKEGKDPRGGLTEIGREYYAMKYGAHLKPGVTGPANTLEKMRRKGSFLTRMFTNPRGPLVDRKGNPTRLALCANAWGEPVPTTLAAAHDLAATGRELLERYKASRGRTARRRSSPGSAAARPR